MAGINREGTAWAYQPGKSPLHRCPAGVKLLALFALSSASFLWGLPALAAAALVVCAASLVAGIRPWRLLRGSRGLAVMLSCIIAVRSFSPDSSGSGAIEGGAAAFPAFSPPAFFAAISFSLGVLCAFAAAALLFSVTTMAEIKDSLESLEDRLQSLADHITGKQKKKRAGRISLALSLMLGFLPRFFETWEASTSAYLARAGKKGSRYILILIPLVTGRMIETAGETAAALEARGYAAD